ncbi:CBS domain-containing protein [Streptomyces brevispora]|uniref:BON domain-containing protein n=1 Tax=Streptomyces brevispora TaxID=887462 RepID=A0A561UR17_9ACTN|nr:CBS domain-containing protein [Streptomyces brevispora]TWG01800.1 BON domain-containing protein [Streptomyces brevispora]WSC16990.1 CBS domain-containing protein [Streptomyces brevispora]
MTVSPHSVRDVMTRTAVAIGRDAGYKEIVELIEQWEVSALPVLAGEGRVVGVVSEADLLLKEEHRDDDPARAAEPGPDRTKAGGITAEDLMSSPAVTVHADATIAEAARIMARRKVKRLPVVDWAGLLEGVVSRSDLLKVFLRPDEEIASEIRATVLGKVPAAAGVNATVAEGIVTLSGDLQDRSLIPLLARAVRAVEGTVDIRVALSGPPTRTGG